MLCTELKEMLMQVALDEASAGERAQVESHVAGCTDCHRAFAEWKLTRKLVAQALPQEEPPQRIRFVASRRPATGFGGWMWQRAFAMPVGVAAGMAILVCSLALAGTHVSYGRGGFEVAFGATPAALNASQPGTSAAAGAPIITRDQLEQMVAAAVRQSEQRQHADIERVSGAVSGELAMHQVVLENLSANVKMFEKTTNNFYKQNAGLENQVASLADRLPAGGREGRQ